MVAFLIKMHQRFVNGFVLRSKKNAPTLLIVGQFEPTMNTFIFTKMFGHFARGHESVAKNRAPDFSGQRHR